MSDARIRCHFGSSLPDLTNQKIVVGARCSPLVIGDGGGDDDGGDGDGGNADDGDGDGGGAGDGDGDGDTHGGITGKKALGPRS